MDAMKCTNPKCRHKIPEHVVHCVVCGNYAGYPNVRAAASDDEAAALSVRVGIAEMDSTQDGYSDTLADFRQKIERESKAVICRKLGVFSHRILEEGLLFQTFYQAVDGEARLPETNQWDLARGAVDAMIFPNYYRNIRFGALSTDEKGVTDYGEYSIVLRETAIESRASVFEENTILFVTRHGIVPGRPIPLGYRATWHKRGDLAIAKLGSKFKSSSGPADHPITLIDRNKRGQIDQANLEQSEEHSDFIEVHIYGPIHARAVEKVTGPTPPNDPDIALLEAVVIKLNEWNATVYTY